MVLRDGTKPQATYGLKEERYSRFMKQQVGLKLSVETNKLICNCVFRLGVLAGVEVKVAVLI